MKPFYRHTQSNLFLILLLGAALVFMIWLAIITDFHLAVIVAALFVAGALVIFGTMTVRVDEHQVQLQFGVGWPGRTIPIAEIRDVCLGVTSPLGGWGVRRLPNGEQYRVAGDRTVDIDLSEGRMVRIGSDEPEELAKAIEDAMMAARKRSSKAGRLTT